MDENEKITTEDTADAPISADDTNAEPSQSEQNAPASDFMNDPAVIDYIQKQVAEGIKKALQGATPKANTVNATEQEKKNFDKMTYKERLNLFKSNPQKYNELSKGK